MNTAPFMSSLIVFSLLALTSFADASNSFTYNDDLVCSYPFEQFQIQSLTCAPTSFVSFGVQQNQNNNYANTDGECAFGDHMDLSGRVTVSQAITREYYLTLSACFRAKEASWYNSKHCSSYRVTIDLIDSLNANMEAQQKQEQQNQNQNNQNQQQNQAQQEYLTYVEAGTYVWSARLAIPKKTFTFKSGALVLGDLVLTPGGRNYQSDTYARQSECTATFSAVYDETDFSSSSSKYQTRYSAAAVVLFAGLIVGAVVAGTHKQRRLCLAGDCFNDNDPVMEGHFATMGNEASADKDMAPAVEMSRTSSMPSESDEAPQNSKRSGGGGFIRKIFGAVRV